MKNLKAKINSNLMVDILLDYIACSVRIALLKKYWSHSLCFLQIYGHTHVETNETNTSQYRVTS